ncbi:hypothetical protein D3C78_1429220 [compost metagenome]
MRCVLMFTSWIFLSLPAIANEFTKELLIGSWVAPEKLFHGYGNLRIDRSTFFWGGPNCEPVPYSIVNNFEGSIFVANPKKWKVITLQLTSNADDPCWGHNSEKFFQFAFLIHPDYHVESFSAQMEIYQSVESRRKGIYSYGIQFWRADGENKIWDVKPTPN